MTSSTRRGWWRRWVASACWIGLAACTRANPQYCETDMDCESGECEVPARECREPLDTPDAGMCASSAQCPAPAPICGDGACRGCGVGADGDAECAARDRAAPLCASDGRCVACVGSAQCDATAPICDEIEGVCRGCNAGAAGDAQCAAKDSAAPRCAATGACVACVADDDCDSEGCDIDAHTCLAPDDIIYVDNVSGSNTGSCTQESPCATIGDGLTHVIAGRDIVKIRATGRSYGESLTMSGLTVRVKGPGARVVAPSVSGIVAPAFTISTGADVAIEGLTIRGANGDTSSHGILCSANQLPTLRLVGVTLENNAGAGVSVGDCTVTVEHSAIAGNGSGGIAATRGELTVEHSTISGNEGAGLSAVLATVTVEHSAISGNAGAGVSAEQGTVTVQQSTISGNEGGGIVAAGGAFAIENNLIVRNGALASAVGGVRVDHGSGLSGTLIFNTLAFNSSSSGVAVSCFGDAVTATSNIIYANAGDAPLAGDCMHSYSDIEGGALGMGNIDSDPLFVNTDVDDFHLQAGSPCRHAADPAGGTDVDIDGDARPQGAGYDMGADEVVP